MSSFLLLFCFVFSTASAEYLRNGAALTNDSVNTLTDRREITAVVHIGPMKTGTSAIDMAARHVRDGLAADGYELAPFLTRNVDPATIAGCFVEESKKHYYSVNFTCDTDVLEETKEMATVHGHNLLMSSEFFSNPDIDVRLLQEFLEPWDNTQIVAYYRRFYDWIVSFHNQFFKFASPDDRKSIEDYVTDLYTGKDHPENYYILYSLRKFKEYMSNIHVVHMSNMPNKNGVEAFYCEALPNAPNACEKTKEMLREGDKEHNHSLDFVYEEIAHYARQQKLWSEGAGLDLAKVALLAKERQERHLKMSKHDFAYKRCPSKKVLDWLLEQSLSAELELFPEYYKEAGEAEVRKEFEKYSTTKLCSVDAKAVVEKHAGWREFFKSLEHGESALALA